MITIIDYKMGNIGSIINMLKKVGFESRVAREKGDLATASKIILPGVGSYNHGMGNLRQSNMLEELAWKVLSDGVPVLGICLGMQLLARSSEEGSEPGLNWISGTVRRFQFSEADKHLRIPHMGWNDVTPTRPDPLVAGLPDDPRYYFVHSYHFVCDNSEDALLTTSYGGEFVSAVRKGNIMGVQFHPEKSHKYGMALMKNFAEI